MANPATPGAAPATPQSPANTPIGPVEILDKSGVSQGTFDAKAKPVAANVNWAPAEPPDFTGAGAFKINDQWATALRYDVTLQNGAFSTGTIVFMNGRRQLATLHIASRDEARNILGVRNVEQIEAGRGKSARSVAGSGTIKGKLQSGDLAYQAAYTPDGRPENTVEAEGVREPAISAGAPPPRTPPNQPATARPTLDPSPSTREVPETPPKPAPETDRTRAVPEQVTKRFIRTDNRYYFPDQTPAFVDRGTTLATRSENQEIVRAFVAIAQARDWQSIRVRGTLAFRQAAWAEAALAGIEVRGYQPSEVEQARLAVLLEARDKPPRAGAEPSKVAPTTPVTPVASTDTAPPAAPSIQRPGAITGTLLEHGPARYKNDPQKESSYFVKVKTATGPHTVWGVDLQRAVAEAGVAIGENITLTKQGSKPVTARERVFDDNGQAVAERAVDAHRNQWKVGSLDKANAFAQGERTVVTQQHPALAPVFGTLAAARRFAEKQFPDRQEDQARFVAVARQVMAEMIAQGDSVPAPKIRAAVVRDMPQQQTEERERAAPLQAQPPLEQDRDR